MYISTSVDPECSIQNAMVKVLQYSEAKDSGQGQGESAPDVCTHTHSTRMCGCCGERASASMACFSCEAGLGVLHLYCLLYVNQLGEGCGG